jgi:hypothetical protein
MSLSETKIIKQITILPDSKMVNVQWANQIKRGTEVISETFERKAYGADLAGFNVGVGSLNVNAFLAAFNTASLDAKVKAEQDLANALGAHATALADKDRIIAEKDALIAAKEAELAAKDTNIDELQSRLEVTTE